MKTREVVKEMLYENTGRHFLDSGGIYGRHWEQNQGVNFDEQPYATVEFWDYNQGEEINVEYTKSIYHFLCEGFEYSPLFTEFFKEFCSDHPDEEDLYLMKVFQRKLLGLGYKVKNLGADNTYNYENNLSQNLLYNYYDIEGEGQLVLISVHQGCDARGGYGTPVAFWDRDYYTIPGRMADGDIYCEEDPLHRWSDDGSNYWDFCGEIRDDNLVLFSELNETYRDNSKWDLRKLGATDDPNELGKVYINEKHEGFCPICGGKLVAS